METAYKLMFFTDHAKQNLELIYIRLGADYVEQIIHRAIKLSERQGLMLVHSEHVEQARAQLDNREAF